MLHMHTNLVLRISQARTIRTIGAIRTGNAVVAIRAVGARTTVGAVFAVGARVTFVECELEGDFLGILCDGACLLTGIAVRAVGAMSAVCAVAAV